MAVTVKTKLDTYECHGPEGGRHEPTVMEAEQNQNSFQIEHTCPMCGVVVIG